MTREEAIKILSKETSMEKVNELNYYAGFSRDKVVGLIQEAMEMGAKALEKQEDSKWIPCSERLPEEREGEFYPLMYITNQYGKVKIGFYRVNDKQWYVYDDDMEDSTRVDNDYVIAWQDEPEPYKEGET